MAAHRMHAHLVQVIHLIQATREPVYGCSQYIQLVSLADFFLKEDADFLRRFEEVWESEGFFFFGNGLRSCKDVL